MTGWRVTSLLREGAISIRCSPWRTALLTVAITVAMVAVGTGELAAISRSRGIAAEARQAGSRVIVVRSDSPGIASLDQSYCTRLRTQAGVLSSGGVVSGGIAYFDHAPAIPFQVVRVTGDMPDVWSGEDVRFLTGVALGDAAAEELGLAVGLGAASNGQVVQIGAILDTSVRYRQASRWFVIPDPSLRGIEECWIEFDSEPSPVASAAIAALLDRSGSATFQRLLPSGLSQASPSAAYRSRPTRLLWLLLGLVTGGVVVLGHWQRRNELALYRAVGSSRPQVAVILLSELTQVMALALAVGVVWSMALHVAIGGDLRAGDLLFVLGNMLSMASVATIVAVVASLALGGGSVADQLKDY